MKNLIAAVVSSVVLAAGIAHGQTGSPTTTGPFIRFLPPALDATGSTVVFGSTVTSQGGIENATSLYVNTTKLGSNVTSIGLVPDGSHAVFADSVDGGEGVGLVDTSSGAMQRQAVDTQGCIRPLALCIGCFYACVVTPHATPDGSKVLYAVQRNQPFYVVNADGTGLTHLPVYSGVLAPSPQRVISANGLVVFASSAPFGPTFAASATDVYVMNLDGTNIRNLTKFGNNSAIFASDATISGDGNTIVFLTNYTVQGKPPAQDAQVWAVQADGSGLRQKTFGPGAATSPSISANGQTGVFIQTGLINILQPFIDLAGVNIAIGVLDYQFSVPQSVVISDDGTRVAFLLGPAAGSAGAVYEINQNGSGIHAIYNPRAISPRGVVSAAGFGLSPSPGGLTTVYGINFAGTVTTADGFPLPDALNGTSVLLNGSKLPMVSISPWQISVQLPQGTPVESSHFAVTFADGNTTPSEKAAIVTAAPALFVGQVQRGSVSDFQAAAFHAGTATPVDDDHPASAGEALEMYGTGFGATDPPVEAGQPSPLHPVARAAAKVAVKIGDVEAEVLFAGLTPGLAGVYQLNVVLPQGLKPGRYAVSLRSGEQTTDALGNISVQ